MCRQRRLNPGSERRQLGRGVLGVAEAGPLAGEVEDAAGPVVVAAPSWSPPLQALAINVTAATTASRVAARRALPAPPRGGDRLPGHGHPSPPRPHAHGCGRVEGGPGRRGDAADGAGMGGSCGDRRNVRSTPTTNTLVGQPVTFAWSARSLRLPGVSRGIGGPGDSARESAAGDDASAGEVANSIKASYRIVRTPPLSG